jgi:hypothetical protein
MKETTKIILAFILGILISGVAVYAGVVLSADKVSYNNTTVKDSLDNLFSDVENGKAKIAAAITDKGVDTSVNDTYSTIVSNIEKIEVSKFLFNEETGYVQYKNNYGDILNLIEMSKILEMENIYPIYYSIGSILINNISNISFSGNGFSYTTGSAASPNYGLNKSTYTASNDIRGILSGTIDVTKLDSVVIEINQRSASIPSIGFYVNDTNHLIDPSTTGTYTIDVSDLTGEVQFVVNCGWTTGTGWITADKIYGIYSE